MQPFGITFQPGAALVAESGLGGNRRFASMTSHGFTSLQTTKDKKDDKDPRILSILGQNRRHDQMRP
jgi:hypothetical protein